MEEGDNDYGYETFSTEVKEGNKDTKRLITRKLLEQ
jgi:hypothetical protein